MNRSEGVATDRDRTRRSRLIDFPDVTDADYKGRSVTMTVIHADATDVPVEGRVEQ